MGAAITELATTSTLGPIVVGPTRPVEELTLVMVPLTEKLSRFNAKINDKKYHLGTRRNKRGPYLDHFSLQRYHSPYQLWYISQLACERNNIIEFKDEKNQN